MRPIVIAAGGTGGHFYPAEALASALLARGHRVVLMTDARTGARLGPVFSGIEHHVLRGAGLAGRGIARAASAVLSLAAGTVQARAHLSKLNPACAVGFGGYPSMPPILAARSMRHRPVIVLHEQNALMGRANRFCARFADSLALGFSATAGVPAGARTMFVGNPVRPGLRALAGSSYVAPSGQAHLLVLGGSLGARVFSDVVPEAIIALSATVCPGLRITQQCRTEDLGRVRAAYDRAGVDAELAPFFDDIAERLASAHLVISRAGASSCAEIAVAGKPAILVPLPGAIDDHQTANARAMVGALVIAQQDFTPARLASELENYLGAPERLEAAARSIAAIARPNAADDLADAVEQIVAQADAAS